MVVGVERFLSAIVMMINAKKINGINQIGSIFKRKPVYMVKIADNIADKVIIRIVCRSPLTTGHIGIFASVYPFKFAGKRASVRICKGIHEITKNPRRMLIKSTLFINVVLPAIAGKPPAIPPNIIEYFVLLFRSKE